MQKFKAVIEYCGTNYNGMQKQNNLKTVQGAIENAATKFTNNQTTQIDFCGRTDAGVHAFGQVIHFEIQNKTETQILKGLNFFLQKSNEEISIKSVSLVESNFHSRFSCTGREYKYFIYNHQTSSPIFQNRMHHVAQKLDIEIMQKSANLFIGEHDFSSFRGKACQALSPIKTVNFLTVTQITPEIIEIHIGAKSFLYKMVRNIVGLLISVGIHKVDYGFVSEIFASKTIDALPYTAPPHGLYFWKASY